MKYQINLPVSPNVSVSFDLDGIAFDFKYRTLKNGMMCCDITSNDGTDERVVAGRICVNESPLLLECPWARGTGNLYFLDKYGSDNPVYTELNDRFALVYDDEYDFESVGDNA